MLRWLKKLLWLCILAGIVAVVGYGFLPKPVPVDTARVTRGSLTVTVSEDGKTRVRDRYTISSPLAGRLHRIKVRAGDPVTAPPALELPGNGVAATGLDDPPANGNGHGPESVTSTFSPGATAVTDVAIIDPIDPGLLDSRQITLAELRVKAMETAIQSSAASREKSNVALEWARTDLNRRQGLVGKGANSKQEQEDAEMLVRARTEDLNIAKFGEVPEV